MDEGLVKLLNGLLKDKLQEDKVQTQIDKYPRPGNVEGLRTPRVNPLIWNQIPPQVRTSDSKSQKSPNALVASLVTWLGMSIAFWNSVTLFLFCFCFLLLWHCVTQSGISVNLRTGPTGHAPLFNQWDGALMFINKQIKTSPQRSKIFKTTDGVRQN